MLLLLAVVLVAVVLVAVMLLAVVLVAVMLVAVMLPAVVLAGGLCRDLERCEPCATAYTRSAPLSAPQRSRITGSS